MKVIDNVITTLKIAHVSFTNLEHETAENAIDVVATDLYGSGELAETVAQSATTALHNANGSLLKAIENVYFSRGRGC